MELEKASARLAPRSPWQAVDLGTKLYRQWAAPVLWVWLAFTLVPFGLMLGWSLLADTLWPLFLFWWLKPLWERPVLAWYSHALFAETLTLKQLFQRWRQYALPGLASQLTWRRFSPARSFNTCVWQLEGAKGEQLSQRLRALNSYPSNRAGIMTIVVLHLEQFMAMGLMVLLYTLVPWQFSLEWSDWFYDQGALQMAIASATLYLVMCVTEPLYVACGFALYLNKRTWLEGWDLQLGLTRLGRHRATRTGATVLMLLALLLPLPEPVTAQPSPAIMKSNSRSSNYWPARTTCPSKNAPNGNGKIETTTAIAGWKNSGNTSSITWTMMSNRNPPTAPLISQMRCYGYCSGGLRRAGDLAADQGHGSTGAGKPQSG